MNKHRGGAVVRWWAIPRRGVLPTHPFGEAAKRSDHLGDLMTGLRLLITGVVGLACLAAPPLRGDEAVFEGGRRVRGTLSLERGRLLFTPAGARRPADVGEVAHVNLAGIDPVPPRA